MKNRKNTQIGRSIWRIYVNTENIIHSMHFFKTLNFYIWIKHNLSKCKKIFLSIQEIIGFSLNVFYLIQMKNLSRVKKFTQNFFFLSSNKNIFTVRVFSIRLRKKCSWIYSIAAKSMYIIDSNQYVIELVAVLLAYFFESIIYMLLAEML